MRVSLVAKTSTDIRVYNRLDADPLQKASEPLSLGELLGYIARVSNPSNQMNTQTTSKLLTYCLKNRHWSVFESASITMEIVTSRAIAQQILRHRSFTFQEFSQRYADVVEREVYQARRQDEKNRQNSIDDMDQDTQDWFLNAQFSNWESATLLYREALKRGIAKEQARFLLPLAAATTIYMTGSIRSWIHYCETRCATGVQKEHRAIALICRDILIKEIPELADYFTEGRLSQ